MADVYEDLMGAVTAAVEILERCGQTLDDATLTMMQQNALHKNFEAAGQLAGQLAERLSPF